MKVVVIADDRVTPEFIRRPLVPLGHQVVILENAAAFRSAGVDLSADAVFAPRQLPGDEFESFASWLRSAHPQTALVMI